MSQHLRYTVRISGQLPLASSLHSSRRHMAHGSQYAPGTSGGRFTSSAASLQSIRLDQPRALVSADIDGDGDSDLDLAAVGERDSAGAGEVVLYRNLGDGRFSDVSFSAASVNASGNMVFSSGLNVGGVESAGIFKIADGIMSPVILSGQAVPDLPGNYFGLSMGGAQINNSGDVVFLANFTAPGRPLLGVFLNSGGALRKIVDQATPVPEVPGATFDLFRGLAINDRGDVAFSASLIGSAASGVFLISDGNLAAVVLNSGSGSVSLNNKRDIALATANGISVYSGGSVTQAVARGQSIPSSNIIIDSISRAAINDAGDIVFVNNQTICCRGGTIGNAVIRVRGGALEKIAAVGDSVPGLPGSFFTTGFGSAEINQSAIVFSSQTAARGGPQIGVIGRFENGQITAAVREDQLVEGLGTLNLIGLPQIDTRQGPLLTFVANASFATGVFATVAGQFTLLFPQIADGTNGSGGWHTTFVLANRSSSPANTTIKFYQDDGTPMNVSIGGRLQSEASIVVPPLGVTQVQTDDQDRSAQAGHRSMLIKISRAQLSLDFSTSLVVSSTR